MAKCEEISSGCFDSEAENKFLTCGGYGWYTSYIH